MPRRQPTALLLALLCLQGVSAAPPPPSSVSPPATPAFSLPSDFAPIPGTPQYQRTSQQRQLGSLLRGFAGVAGAQVVLAGEPPALALSAVITPRPNAVLDATLIEGMVGVMVNALPSLAREGVSLTDDRGRALFARGQAQVPAPPGPGSLQVWWLLAGAALVGALVAWTLLRRGRRGGGARPTDGEFGFLAKLSDADLHRLFGDERAGLPAAVSAAGSEAVARRLGRYARARRLPVVAVRQPLDPRVRQAVARALRDKARQAGVPFRERGYEAP